MKVVAPKKEQLAIVMEEYRIVMEALAVKEAELKEVMDKVHPSGSGSSLNRLLNIFCGARVPDIFDCF